MDWRKGMFGGLAVICCSLLFWPAFAGGRAALASENSKGLLQNGAVARAATRVPTDSGGIWPHEQSDLSPDPEVIFERLDNGFRYVILPNAKPRDRTRLHLVVEAGSFHETPGQRGIAHFLEHMLFNGSTHFPPGELIRYFQKIGMQFGPDANARTGFYETVYDINLPASDRQSLREALLVMQDYAQGALLLPSEIERERGVILAEKRTRDSADYRTYVASLKFELAGTRFPERLPIGVEEDIRTADRSEFKSFYDTWYRPDRMILVMVGDVDPAMARELIEAQFGLMAPRAPAKELPAIGTLAHGGLKTFYHHEAELGSTSVTVQVLDHTSRRADDAAFQQQQMEEQLAGQIIRNRLNRQINQAGSPITDAGAGSGIFLRQIRYGYISADCQPDDWQDALALVEQTLRQVLQFGFTANELERVKQDYRTGLKTALAQAETRDSARLARELINSLTDDKVFRSPEQKLAFAEPLLDAVTTDDLLNRLRAVWASQQRLVMVTGNAKIAPASGSPEEQIAAVFNRSADVAVTRPVQRDRVLFPYLEPPPVEGRIAGRQEADDIGVTMVRFQNDVRLNVKPTDFSANEVRFVLSFGQGRKGVPVDRPALAAVAEDVVNESGLGRLDKESLAQALAGKETEMTFAVEDDRFVFEGRSTPEEIELMFQLMHAAIVDPAFREDAWQLALNRYRQMYRTMLRSVDGVMSLYGWRFLSGGDPRFGLPPLEDLDGLTAADVEKWIAPALGRGFMELAVVGDVDRDAVVRLAARYLGALPQRGSDAAGDGEQPGPDFPEARRMTIAVPTQIDKALLVMALPTDDIWEIGRTRRLNILAEIIAERLRLRIREKLGAAYSTSAFSWPSRAYPGYGMLVMHIPLAVETLDLVEAEIRDILRDIRTDGVSQGELQRAVEPVLTGIKDRFRENGYWLGTVLADASRHPVQLEWSRSIMKDYAGIRRADIDDLAQRYLDLSRLAIIRAHPPRGE